MMGPVCFKKDTFQTRVHLLAIPRIADDFSLCKQNGPKFFRSCELPQLQLFHTRVQEFLFVFTKGFGCKNEPRVGLQTGMLR